MANGCFLMQILTGFISILKYSAEEAFSKKPVNAVNSDTKIATEPALKATDVKLAVRPQKSSKGPKIIAIIFAAIMILYLFN